MKKIILLLTISCILIGSNALEDANSSAPVISRNERIQEMIDGLNVQNTYYEEMMN